MSNKKSKIAVLYVHGVGYKRGEANDGFSSELADGIDDYIDSFNVDRFIDHHEFNYSNIIDLPVGDGTNPLEMLLDLPAWLVNGPTVEFMLSGVIRDLLAEYAGLVIVGHSLGTIAVIGALVMLHDQITEEIRVDSQDGTHARWHNMHVLLCGSPAGLNLGKVMPGMFESYSQRAATVRPEFKLKLAHFISDPRDPVVTGWPLGLSRVGTAIHRLAGYEKLGFRSFETPRPPLEIGKVHDYWDRKFLRGVVLSSAGDIIADTNMEKPGNA